MTVAATAASEPKTATFILRFVFGVLKDCVRRKIYRVLRTVERPSEDWTSRQRWLVFFSWRTKPRRLGHRAPGIGETPLDPSTQGPEAATMSRYSSFFFFLLLRLLLLDSPFFQVPGTDGPSIARKHLFLAVRISFFFPQMTNSWWTS